MENETKFLVQVGRGTKGAYKIRYSFTNQAQANFYYAGINIGNGYKKRLVRVDGRPGQAKQTLARDAS
jgi:hypothetical protein